MIHGVVSVPRVASESVCRSTQEYRFTDLGLYRIHSTALMPNIPFAYSLVSPCQIDSSIFVNDAKTKPQFQSMINFQNFLTTRYVGRAPLEWYDHGQYTQMGRQFVLVCREGNPNEDHRSFGTDGAIHSYNRSANENIRMPGGGE